MSKPTPAAIAAEIKETADRLGWVINVRGAILTISKRFTPGSNDELVGCDMEYSSILGKLPRPRPGSDWGTDCGGIGAMTALEQGLFVMNKSGGNKRVLNALARIV